MNILLVEDDLQLGKALCRALELTGFNLCWVRLLADAENKLSPGGFDLMLLDLTLPDGDGLQKLIAWRAAGQNIPIIILTARDRIESLVNSLDSGADDFLAKPFALPEPHLARQGGQPAHGRLRFANLEPRHAVSRSGQPSGDAG